MILPFLSPSLRARAVPSLVGGAVLLLMTVWGSGCGPTDTIKTFDVELVTLSECSQVGAGAVQCEDAEELARHTTIGQWIIDERAQDAFTLTTHQGRTLPGLYFANNSEVSEQCTGGGGTCYFARTRTDALDVESNCIEINQRALDSVLDPETNTLNGLFSDITLTDENCGTPFVEEVIIQVTGTLSEESVYAREVFE